MYTAGEMDGGDVYCMKTSSFLKEVKSMPLLQSAVDLYTSTKTSSRVLNTGLAVVEHTLSNLWGNMFSHSKVVSRLDGIAGDSVCKLKERYPALSITTSEIKEGMSLKKTVRGIMRTPPGQTLIRSVDWAVDKSEALLDRLTPRHLSPRKRKLTRAMAKKEAPVVKDHAYASEDSGACEADNGTDKSHRTQMLGAVRESTSNRQLLDHVGLIDKIYRFTMILPLEILVQSLKSFRRYTGGKRRRQALSPEKESEIDARRKMSPKKKAPSTFLGKIRSRTYKLLGYHSAIPIDLSHLTGCKSPERIDAEKKRKHDEILSDEGSDTDNDLDNFDYDNYESEEDPDYEPDSSDDSEDSDIDDVDEAVEAECQCYPEPDAKHLEQDQSCQMKQLKDTNNSAKLLTADNHMDMKNGLPSETPVAKPDDIVSLKPQWQTFSK